MTYVKCGELSPTIMEYMKKENVELYQFLGLELPQNLKDWLDTKPKVMKKPNIFQKFINRVVYICKK